MINKHVLKVLNEVFARITNADWYNGKDHLKTELAPFLTDDLYEGNYELVNASREFCILKQQLISPNEIEIILHSSGMADKATFVIGEDGKWRLKSFLGQCTGCLGSGKILEGVCESCSGTGWGLRPNV